MEESKPDRTSDGVREIMIAIAKTYEASIETYILFSTLLKNSSMQRLTLDRYLNEAELQGLIDRSRHSTVVLTSKGSDYLVAKGIIEG